jgi:hypothetical protein
VFENIHEVEFDPSKKIIAMYSAEKEKIDFVKPVNPVGKNVEDWMTEGKLLNKLTNIISGELNEDYNPCSPFALSGRLREKPS